MIPVIWKIDESEYLNYFFFIGAQNELSEICSSYPNFQKLKQYLNLITKIVEGIDFSLPGLSQNKVSVGSMGVVLAFCK